MPYFDTRLRTLVQADDMEAAAVQARVYAATAERVDVIHVTPTNVDGEPHDPMADWEPVYSIGLPGRLDAATLQELAHAADWMAEHSEHADRNGRCAAYLRDAARAARAAAN